MKISIPTHYHGRNSENKPIVDFEKSGKIIYCGFANLQGVCFCAVKVYSVLRFDIVDEYFSNNLDINEAKKHYNQFIDKYNPVKLGGRDIAVLGNSMLNQICNLPLSSADDFRGFEAVKIDFEDLLFAVQSNLENIKFSEDLKELWHEELKTFDLELIRKNEQTCHRIFALGSLILGLETNPRSFRIPKRTINEVRYYNQEKLSYVRSIDLSTKEHYNFKDYYKSENKKIYVYHHGTKNNYNKVENFNNWYEVDSCE